MTPVLLSSDTKRIAEEKETLSNLVPLYQSIYNAVVKATGITPTLADIHKISHDARANDKMPLVDTYVTGKLVDKVMPFAVNGVNLSRAAVTGMIEKPDTSAIKEALAPFAGGKDQYIFMGAGQGARHNL